MTAAPDPVAPEALAALDPDGLGPRLAAIAATWARYRAEGRRCFATSSFQSNSVVLLHLLHRFAPEVPVYFLHTGYHFPETLRFRRQLAQRLGLRVIDLVSPVSRAEQRDPAGRLLFTSDPDRCCHLNKVLPLDPVLAAHDVWINGVRGAQSATRAAMGTEEPGRGGILRHHPILDWTGREVWAYSRAHGLPGHPLEDQGYLSVGCAPCTRRLADEPDLGDALDDRGGRWAGLTKTECGLHLNEGSP